MAFYFNINFGYFQNNGLNRWFNPGFGCINPFMMHNPFIMPFTNPFAMSSFSSFSAYTPMSYPTIPNYFSSMPPLNFNFNVDKFWESSTSNYQSANNSVSVFSQNNYATPDYTAYTPSISPTKKSASTDTKKSELSKTSNGKSATPVSKKQTSRKMSNGKIDSSYQSLTQAQAREKALKDPNLEELKGGKNWSVSDRSFVTDIPFAKKGTSAILQKVSEMIGEDLVITSALGTGQKGNPHKLDGYDSHHNAENPKLDIRAHGNGNALAAKLRNTGYFSRVSIESDHLDVQIDPSKFNELNLTA